MRLCRKAASHPAKLYRTLAADKAYDSADFIIDCRNRGVTPHVAMNITENRDSALDARTARHPGYLISQRIRKRIEECFGWSKDGRALRKIEDVRPAQGRLCDDADGGLLHDAQALEAAERRRIGPGVALVSVLQTHSEPNAADCVDRNPQLEHPSRSECEK